MRLLVFLPLFAALLNAQTPIPAAPAAASDNELATISGTITGKDGTPLRKAQVMLRQIGMPSNTAVASESSGRSQAYGAVTDAQGKYSFDGVDPGRYMLSADHAGYLHGNYSAGSNASPANTLVNLAAGQRMTEANIQLVQQSTVSGRVFDEDGDPAMRALVSLVRKATMNGVEQYVPFGNANSDENGDFKLTGLQAGKYYLRASPPMIGPMMEPTRRAAGARSVPEEGAIPTYYPGTPDLSTATMIVVNPAQQVTGMNLRLQKAVLHHVRGKASGPLPGESLTRFAVVAIRQDSSFMMPYEKSTRVGTDGTFDLGGLAPGRYSLALAQLQGAMQVFALRPVQLGEQDLDDIVLNVIPPADLHGVVRFAGESAPRPAPASEGQGQPSSPAPRIGLTPLDIAIGGGNVASKPDGSFTLERVSAGHYRVVVTGMGNNGYVKSIKLNGEDALENGLDLSQGVAGSLEITIATDGGEVSGSVKDKDGHPVSGGITLLPDMTTGAARPDLFKTGAADASGQFRLRGITPGKYRIFAFDQSDAMLASDPDFIKSRESVIQKVNVEPSGTQQVSLVK